MFYLMTEATEVNIDGITFTIRSGEFIHSTVVAGLEQHTCTEGEG